MYNCNHHHEPVYPTSRFFQDYLTELFELSSDGNGYEMFESMRIYIERFGRPYNYLKSVAKLNLEREQVLQDEERYAKHETAVVEAE